MKKLLAISGISLLSLTLMGCSTSEFDKDLSFENVIEGEEKAAVISLLTSQLQNANEINVKYSEYTYNELNTIESTSDSKLVVYSNDMIKTHSKGTTKNKTAGVTVTETRETTSYHYYDYTSSSVTDYYIDDKDSRIVNTVYDKSVFDDEKLSLITSTILLEQLSSIPCYKKNNNYYFVKTEMGKNVTPVSWGNESKEEKTATKALTYMEVDSSYHITKLSNYAEKSENHDTKTNEWYNDLTVTSKISMDIEVKYGDKTTCSDKEFNKNTKYIDSANVLLDNNLSRVSIYETKPSLTKRHVTEIYSVPASGSGHTISTKVKCRTKQLDSDKVNEGSVNVTFNVTNSDKIISKDSTLTIKYKEAIQLKFEFDIEINDKNNITVSNPKVSVY